MAEEEIIKIFDKDYHQCGTATRECVHREGLWHETFHCWFYTMEQDELIIYFQKRSPKKKDFPNQLDITAAGHLLADETVLDGFREVREELGVDVQPEEADFLGVFPVCIDLGTFIDNEFTNVYLVKREIKIGDFSLQEEEVESLFCVPLSKLKKMLVDPTLNVSLTGYHQQNYRQTPTQAVVSKKDFCANAESYYEELVKIFEEIRGNHLRTID
ncbi:NUDIX hydrolase [Enterococcus wangshanyuanii]|uniref:Nudix hydrolase n=1 Tax=Enterococcus wangshanyuanii TaxID=2005703 RepID=A0ABQ1NMG7_9ENTE|nr:NUDIX domain-containing protein [Enterococcus wangshanyuanii]GGC80798.1 putative Nudix hydrolase [Enterococcus wangshanyuanii]